MPIVLQASGRPVFDKAGQRTAQMQIHVLLALDAVQLEPSGLAVQSDRALGALGGNDQESNV